MKKTLLWIIMVIMTGSCITFSDHIFCQSVYNLSNGQVILEMNGALFNITYADSIPIINGIIMVKYEPGTDSAVIEGIESNHDLTLKNILLANWRSYYVPDEDSTASLAESLLGITGVNNICFNYSLNYFSSPANPPSPNDPQYSDQWYISDIHVDDAWEITTGDPNLVVGVLDNGVDYYNPDLEIEQDPSIYPNWGQDNNNHGTWMSALIAAKTNNANRISGIAGGWNSAPVTIKMFKTCNINGDPDLEMVDDALYEGGNQGIRLFNLSFGIETSEWTCEQWSNIWPSLTETLEELHNDYNAVIFVSTGNKNLPTIAYPACLDPIVNPVGATDREGKRWENTGKPPDSGSDWGENTFISTPGYEIIQPTVGDPFEFEIPVGNGATSPACAIATGVGALMLSANPCLSNEDVRQILISSADKVWTYDYGWNDEKPGHSRELGYGKIDAYEAVLFASDPITEITQDTTFNEPKWFTHDLTVKAGSTLTITSTIKFTSGTKIIVEKGGHLIVDGGLLTTDCPDFWGGIELESDPDLPQVPTSNQGYLTLQNDAVIEKAYFGVKNYIPQPNDECLPFPSSYGGGIVWAEDASFINCAVAASFGQYPDYPSSSRFKNCSFITNQHFFSNQNPSCFVNMGNVSNIKFFKCTFDNQGSQNLIGRGIQAMNSTFYVDGSCSVQQSPCPKENIEPSVFHNLDYGIYALTTGTTNFFKVQNSEFLGNMHGIYASAVNFATIVSNSFSIIGATYAYGLYFENSTGYHIEDNHFTGDGIDELSEETGVYIRNSGSDQNWVYNNWFTDLFCGAIGDGINRGYMEKTGLCFKCNVFSGNRYDLIVTKDEGVPISADHSIAFYQGYDLPGDTMPAGNEFSQNDGFSIYNEVSPIVYNYHQYYPQTIKIYPDPVTTLTVGRNEVYDTHYSKENSCKPWIGKNEPEPEDLMAQLQSSTQSILETQTELESLIDNGNTDDLNLEVLLASPDSSTAVYNSLLTASPLLSDTVMISAIQNETTIPNAMLRDVLVANPQSAKSSEVIQKLDERFIPMTQEMKDQVLEGINIIGGRDALEMELASFQDKWGLAYQGLQRHYLSDTSDIFQSNIRSLLSGIQTPEAKYLLSSIFLNNGSISEAETILDSLPLLFEQTSQEMSLYNDFGVIADYFQTIAANGKLVLECDSAETSSLQPLLEHDAQIPGAIARNILIATSGLDYEEPLNLPSEQAASGPAFNRQEDNETANGNITLFPNPASGYVIASYEVYSTGSPLALKIFDYLGKEVVNIPLTFAKDQKVILISSLTPGSYLVQVQNKSKILLNTKLVKL